MRRVEPVLLALFFACWLVSAAHFLGLASLAGGLDLGLNGLFALAAVLGWVAGNVYLLRRQPLAAPERRRLLLIYLFGPPGLLYLLRAMASAEQQAAAPLVPLLAFGVFGIFFLVPTTLRRIAR